ncbi:putative disease resistance protein RGA3 [Papaver somniferum]|uniref:putative disease resistance protein RGA3 n=1 Tax=Papaver somniferum TaxID=3469 RepID=UPI000E6F8E5A|nr:putative disease resistance protein RGA3 [Papaver somniferum]
MGITLCYETEERKALIHGGEITDNAEFHKNIYPIIKLSYDRLPSSALQQCFSYCSIFPRGYEIDREEIIQLWMADGFLVPSSREREMEISMEDIGNDLTSCSRTVAGNAGCSTLRANEVVSFSEIRRLHLVFNEDMPRRFPEVSIYKDRLRSLVALEVGDCDKIQNVFRKRNLRVLYLSGSTIQKVPASLSKLRHLRYLNLSSSQNLDVLDDQSVNSLYNLQTLVLNRCTSLSKLPEGTGSMRSLRHLDISYTGIKVLPISVTSLQNLRTLDVSNCTNFEGLPENVEALKDLRSLNLSHTGIKILPTSVASLQNLRALDVSNCTNFEGLPENIGSLKDLLSLNISHTKVSRLPNSISGLERLMTLRLHSCPNLEDLPKGIEALRWLKGLDITGTKVKVVPDQLLLNGRERL